MKNKKRRINYADRAKRQRRSLIIFALLIIVLGTYIGIGALAESTASNTVVTVDSGDTLWALCETYKPENVDLRKYIDKVRYINHLKTSDLAVGQEIIFPNS